MSPTVALDSARLYELYERDADEYCRSLPLEHFMESTTQSTQRKITVSSLDLVSRMWPEFQVFSELLIQYVLPGEDLKRPIRVVPDNMVFVHSEPIQARGSYMLPLQTIVPTLVLEYVSKDSNRKDYFDNRLKYEVDLHVPNYLVFHPEKQNLTLFRMDEERYETVKPNFNKRLAIPDLDLEVAILDRWVRYWFRGELLPLPGDLLDSRNAERVARKAEEKARKTAEQARKAAEQARKAEEQARISAEQSRDLERAARLELEAEIARLRNLLANNAPPPAN